MDVRDIVRAVQVIPLQELGPLFEVLSEMVFGHRLENNGYVPLEIFPFCVGIGGVYPCVEVIVEANNGFWLKKRAGDEEQGWKDQYQIPGQTARLADQPKDIFNRLAKEIFGDNTPDDFQDQLKFVGIEIHEEYDERRVTCWTAVWRTEVIDSMLFGEWQWFNSENIKDESIVSHHKDTLKWFIEGSPIFIRLS